MDMKRNVLVILAMIFATLAAVAQVSTCVLTGHVRDTEGKPVIGAVVRIGETSQGGVSKAPDGKFTVQRIPTREYELRTTALGYTPAVDEIRLAEDHTSAMPVRFVRGTVTEHRMCQDRLIVTGKFLMVNPGRLGTTSIIRANELR